MIDGPKILFLDIETAPNFATVWSIWNQNIGLNQLLESGYMLSWAAKWKGAKEILFDSVNKSGKDGVTKSAWKVINEADIVVTFNGRKFDMPNLNKEFLLHKLPPPAPYKQVDLYQIAKKRFVFVSYKMAYITKFLGFKGKVKVDHQLWLDCIAGKPAAWKRMEKYNKRDVTELEGLYNRFLPWVDTHPSYGLYKDTKRPVCTNCGSTHVNARGYQVAKTQVYKKYQCQNCGTWMRSRYAEKRENPKNVLTQVAD